MGGSVAVEVLAVTPEAHHAIGISQNLSENIPHFLYKNCSDPAIKVEFVCIQLLIDRIDQVIFRTSFLSSKVICSRAWIQIPTLTTLLNEMNFSSKATAFIDII